MLRVRVDTSGVRRASDAGRGEWGRRVRRAFEVAGQSAQSAAVADLEQKSSRTRAAAEERLASLVSWAERRDPTVVHRRTGRTPRAVQDSRHVDATSTRLRLYDQELLDQQVAYWRHVEWGSSQVGRRKLTSTARYKFSSPLTGGGRYVIRRRNPEHKFLRGSWDAKQVNDLVELAVEGAYPRWRWR